MTQIFTEGRTKEPIRGFTSKAGNVFDAFLVLKQDENGKDNISFDFNGVGDNMPQTAEQNSIDDKENEDGSLQNQ